MCDMPITKSLINGCLKQDYGYCSPDMNICYRYIDNLCPFWFGWVLLLLIFIILMTLAFLKYKKKQDKKYKELEEAIESTIENDVRR